MAVGIIGFPWLAAVIVSCFTALLTFLSKVLVRRVAIVAALVVVLGGMVLGFMAALQVLSAALVFTAPEPIVKAAQFIIPNNFAPVVSTIVSAHLLRWAYEWNVKILQLKLF